MKKFKIIIFTQMMVVLLLVIGWIKCLIKAIDCNWDPIDKAEIIYTGGVFLGYGGIIGWFDIEDK